MGALHLCQENQRHRHPGDMLETCKDTWGHTGTYAGDTWVHPTTEAAGRVEKAPGGFNI